LAKEELGACRELIRRRLAGEPIAYLVGRQEFWSLPLAVDARVLVPRPETELLVAIALAFLKGKPAPPVPDLGQGSGARAIARAPALLDAGGLLAMEVGAGQAPSVARLLDAAGFANVVSRKDLAGIERVVHGEKR